jgi:tetratricopeptide (TPR) repeat protein
LITLHDGVPVPKVIDFGIAKATGQSLTDRTLYTGFAQLVGTPLYMSPEQAEMSGLDVDTRSDVYSLGVLLYELLTGTTPFDQETMRQAALDEMRRIIREEEPPKPSTRLSSLGATRATVSANRKAEARNLDRVVRGELDWIVMKALEKDRRRRYETANDFATDVRRYLDDEPVAACPPSAWYRFGKIARRNRVALMTSALVASALVLGTAVSTWQAIRATRAERVARQQRDAADAAQAAEARTRKRAEDAERTARAEADRAKAVNDFLTEDLLTQAEPAKNSVEDKVTLLEVVDRAAAKVGDRFHDQPEAESALRKTLADTYHGLGSFAKAERQAQAALEIEQRLHGPEAAETFNTLAKLGEMRSHLGRSREALELLRQATEGLRRTLGPDHPDTLSSSNDLATAYRAVGRTPEAIVLLEETLKLQTAKLGPDHPHTSTSRNNLAVMLADLGKRDEARKLHEQALAIKRRTLGPEHPDTLASMTNLAVVLSQQGKRDEARKLHEQALEIKRRTLGPEHPDTLTSMNNLAVVLEKQGKRDEARKLHEQALEIQRRNLGPEHPDTLTSMNNLAVVLHEQGKRDEARKLYEQALEIYRRNLGPEHPATLTLMSNLAVVLSQQGKRDEALKLYEQTLEIQRRVLGPDHPGLWFTISQVVVLMLGGHALSDEDRSRGLELARKLAELRPDDQLSWKWLGVAEYANGHWDAAIAAANRWIALRKDQEGHLFLHLVLAMAHARRGDRAEAQRGYDKVQMVILLNGARGWNDAPRWLIDEAKTLLGEIPSKGDRVRVRELVRRGIENDPKSAGPWRLRASSDYQDGQWDDALRAIETWRELVTDAGRKYNAGLEEVLRAAVHARKGERDAARTWYDRAIRARDELRKAGAAPNPDYLELRLDTEALLGLEPPPGEPGQQAKVESPTPPK